MVDITPKPQSETRILFVPDERRRYDGTTIDNVRRPLRDDQLIGISSGHRKRSCA